MLRSIRSLAAIALPLLGACAAPDAGSPAAAAPVPAEAMAAVDSAAIMTHIRALADDSMLGRAPGSVGESRAVAYIQEQFRGFGLAPGNPSGGYIQPVPLVAMTADRKSVV